MLVTVLLAVVSLLYTTRHLGFKTDQRTLLPRSTFIEHYAGFERLGSRLCENFAQYMFPPVRRLKTA